MSIDGSRLVGNLLLAVLLVGVTSCASNRKPDYVYTPASVRDAERVDTRSERTPRTGTRAQSSTRPAPERTASAFEVAAADSDELVTERSGLFAAGRQADSSTSIGSGDVDSFAETIAESPRPGYRLRPNDPLVIQLRGIPESGNLELLVDDRGYVNLPYLTPVRAEGLTPSELQRIIQKQYIEERIYRHITVNILLPSQYYFVRGEIRQPGRFPLSSGMTVLKAIAAAGGYTEFANPRRISIIRAGETIEESARDMERNPEDDMDVKAGDVIIVPRSIF